MRELTDDDRHVLAARGISESEFVEYAIRERIVDLKIEASLMKPWNNEPHIRQGRSISRWRFNDERTDQERMHDFREMVVELAGDAYSIVLGGSKSPLLSHAMTVIGLCTRLRWAAEDPNIASAHERDGLDVIKATLSTFEESLIRLHGMLGKRKSSVQAGQQSGKTRKESRKDRRAAIERDFPDLRKHYSLSDCIKRLAEDHDISEATIRTDLNALHLKK
jgi:hypothetical protein